MFVLFFLLFVVFIGNFWVWWVFFVVVFVGVEFEYDKFFIFVFEWKIFEFFEKNFFGFFFVFEFEDGIILRECVVIVEYSEYEFFFCCVIFVVEWRRKDLCGGMRLRFGVLDIVGV